MNRNFQKIISVKSVSFIDELTISLKNIGIQRFCHDMTFGNGQISILTNHINTFEFYYKNEFPTICTDVNGRTLTPGFYLNKKLQKDHYDYSRIYPIISTRLRFKNLIHFCEISNNCQHLYSFSSDLNEDEFLHLIINNLSKIKSFIEFYKTKAHAVIVEAKKIKNRINLPFEKNSANNLIPYSNQPSSDFMIVYGITHRELECMRYILLGKSSKETGRLLNISNKTVENHWAHIKEKLGLKKRYDLLQFAIENDIIFQ